MEFDARWLLCSYWTRCNGCERKTEDERVMDSNWISVWIQFRKWKIATHRSHSFVQHQHTHTHGMRIHSVSMYRSNQCLSNFFVSLFYSQQRTIKDARATKFAGIFHFEIFISVALFSAPIHATIKITTYPLEILWTIRGVSKPCSTHQSSVTVWEHHFGIRADATKNTQNNLFYWRAPSPDSTATATIINRTTHRLRWMKHIENSWGVFVFSAKLISLVALFVRSSIAVVHFLQGNSNSRNDVMGCEGASSTCMQRTIHKYFHTSASTFDGSLFPHFLHKRKNSLNWGKNISTIFFRIPHALPVEYVCVWLPNDISLSTDFAIFFSSSCFRHHIRTGWSCNEWLFGRRIWKRRGQNHNKFPTIWVWV